MDLNKLKLFGFPRHVMQYNVYDPRKIRYLKSKKYGLFEAPRRLPTPEVQTLVKNYEQRKEYEKYMNPKGFKYTYTSNFPKVGQQFDLLNLKCFLVRTDKQYNTNQIKFMVDKNLSKPEIHQFLNKLYGFNIAKIQTAILPGEVKAKMTKKNIKYYRTREYKKAVVDLDIKVDEKFRKIKKE
jgi:ribosomal protein L23